DQTAWAEQRRQSLRAAQVIRQCEIRHALADLGTTLLDIGQRRCRLPAREKRDTERDRQSGCSAATAEYHNGPLVPKHTLSVEHPGNPIRAREPGTVTRRVSVIHG